MAQKLAAVLAPKPSIGDLLGASLGKIFQEVQQHFVEGLAQVTPAVRNPLDLKDSPAPPSNITWDNSQELREATELTSKAPTRGAGIEKLRTLCESSPTSSAPYALLAQALRYDDQYDQAESLLIEALPRVHSRGEIFDALGNISSVKHDYLKATGYYLTAAYAMNPYSTDWGTLVYLSGVYRACGNEERARECQEAAAAMRGGNPVELRGEKFAAIREAIDSHKIL